jgi:hypothetical protein
VSRMSDLDDSVLLEDLPFNTRARNALQAAKCKTVGDVRNMTDLQLFCYRQCGWTTIRHIRRVCGNKVEKVDDGGPAFPVVPVAGNVSEGMTLRDYFASKAIPAAYLAYSAGRCKDENRPDAVSLNYEDDSDARLIAESAYVLADAMIAFRKK